VSTSVRSRASTSRPTISIRKLYIHPDECIECGACEPECPVNAIFHESAVPEEWTEFNDLDAR